MSFAETCPDGAIAVVTDVHPDEYTSEAAYDLHALLEHEPIDGVWAIRGNELTLQNNRATGRHDRFAHTNLQTVTDEYAVQHPEEYEVQRYAQLGIALRAARLVIQTHASRCNVAYAWYNENASVEVQGVVSAIGISRAVLMRPPIISYGRPTHCVLEFSALQKDSYLQSMYGLLQKLAAGEVFTPEPIQEYDFIGDLMVDDARRMGLPDEHEPWTPFSPSAQEQLVRNGIPGDAVPSCWSYEMYGRRHGYMGELVRPRLPAVA
jgi:hypothetical protein